MTSGVIYIIPHFCEIAIPAPAGLEAFRKMPSGGR